MTSNLVRAIFCTSAAFLLVSTSLVAPASAEGGGAIHCSILLDLDDPQQRSNSNRAAGDGIGDSQWKGCSDWVADEGSEIAGDLIEDDGLSNSIDNALHSAARIIEDPGHQGGLNVGCDKNCLGGSSSGSGNAACGQECNPPPPRQRPPRPESPTTFLQAFDHAGGNSTGGHENSTFDWDQDGVADLLDTVNVPSESQWSTDPGDHISLPAGLPPLGFVLLIEPQQREAQLALADPRSLATPYADNLTGPEALDLLEDFHGPLLRNALAGILPANLTVHFHSIQQDQNASIPLTWNSTVPVDGTWLLLRVDPTRLINVHIGDLNTTLSPPAPSHYSTGLYDYRWEFLNPHRDESFCYDATTASQQTDCQGAPWPGWIRAYSGASAYTLQALAAGLQDGVIPYTGSILDALPRPPPVSPPSPQQQSSMAIQLPTGARLETSELLPGLPAEAGIDAAALPKPELGPSIPADLRPAELDLFDSNSPWQLLGNESRLHPTGIGVDYLIPAGNESDAMVLRPIASSQSESGISLHSKPVDRRFVFHSAYIETPAAPRNLTFLSLGIESYDEDDSGQAFLLDGKHLAELLDVRADETIAATVDAAHLDGFTYWVRDVNGDGIPDLVFYVPHFSTTWIKVYNPDTYAFWWDVEMTSDSTGWLAGAQGAVYRYGNGQLQRFEIPGIHQEQYSADLAIISDTEFYVVGGYGKVEDGHPTAFIAHYKSPFLDNSPSAWMPLYEAPPQAAGTSLVTVWFNDNGQLGYAGGGTGLWLRYSNNAWQLLASPIGKNCSILAIDFGNDGKGYLGVSRLKNPQSADTDSCGTDMATSGVMYYDGSKATKVNAPTMRSIHHVDAVRGYAVGLPQRSNNAWNGMGIYDAGQNWDQVAVPGMSGWWGFVLGAAPIPNSEEDWFTGVGGTGSTTCSMLLQRVGTTWTSYQCIYGDYYLNDIDFASAQSGLLVGPGVVARRVVEPEYMTASVSAPSSVTSGDTVTATCSTSRAMRSFEIDWGDGYQSTSSATYSYSASHYYNSVGLFTIGCRAVDYDASASGSKAISVNPVSVSANGGTDSFTFPASCNGETKWRHYRIAGGFEQRAYRVYLNAPAYMQLELLGKAGASVQGTANQWGQWISSSTLVGGVAPGQSLNLAVFQPYNQCHRSYTLSITQLGPENPPTNVVVPSYANMEDDVVVRAWIPSAHGLWTRLRVDWGDGTSVSNSFWSGGGSIAWNGNGEALHKYAQPGMYQITLSTINVADQVSSSVQRTLTLRLPAQGHSGGATPLNAVEARLTGSVTDFGGAPSVEAHYVVSRKWSPSIHTSPVTMTAPGALPEAVVGGLLGGTTYEYSVAINNGVVTSQSVPVSFTTMADTTVLPMMTASQLNKPLGTDVSLTLTGSEYDANNVAYWIQWGDGIEQRVPTTGWVPWDQATTATHRYGFAGSNPIEVRLQDESMARSNKITATAVTTGSAPIALFEAASSLSDSTLKLTVGSLAFSPGTDARLMYRPKSWTWYNPNDSASWTMSDWSSNVAPGSIASWATLSLEQGRVYEARVEFRTSTGSSWLTPDNSLLFFQTNRAPTLTPLSVNQATTYLDSIKFAVTYKDIEGNAPANGVALTLNGQSYTLNRAMGTPNYKAGVEYYYLFQPGQLPAGRSYQAIYSAQDAYQSATHAAPWLLVKGASLLATDFSQAEVGGNAQGFTSGHWSGYCSCSPKAKWQVVDTEAATMPSRLAIGHRGKAMWFGNEALGSYEDPNGQRTAGELWTGHFDLRTLDKPSLSYSSYYETEDLQSGRDVKQVQARYRYDVPEWTVDGDWTPWFTVQTVQGYAGGYGQWRTQHVPLSSWAAYDAVELRFVFDSVDGRFNNQVGWFVDDVVVGQDADRDTLPDTLETMRKDVRISTQHQPTGIADGASGRGYVRRLARSPGTEFLLEAVVTHPSPTGLKVSIGADGAGTPVVLYDNGNTGTCQKPAAFPNGQAIPYASKVNVVSGGLRIYVNLNSCGFPTSAFKEQANWFLEVKDKTGNDGKQASIDGLRIWTTGKTDMRNPDSDYDGRSDGVELNAILDPVGTDADQDKVHEVSDPNDSVPSWMPHVKLASANFRSNFDVNIDDLLGPMEGFEAYAVDQAGSQTPLSASSLNGPGHRRVTVPGDMPPPVAFVIRLADVYGNVDSITVHMAGTGADYAPVRVGLVMSDFAASIEASFDQVIAEENGSPIQVIGIGGAVVVNGARFGYGGLAIAGVVVVGYLLYDTYAGANDAHIETTNTLGQEYTYRTVPNLQAGQRNTCRSDGLCIRYIDAQLAFLASAGTLTAGEILNAIANAQYRFPDAGDRTRLIWDIGQTVIVVVLVGKGTEMFLDTAFKWQLPTAFEWADQPAVEDFLLAEKTMQQRMAETFYEATKDSLLLFRYLGPWECAIPIEVDITRTSPDFLPEPDLILVVPKCIHDAWVYGLKTFEDSTKYFLGQGFVDMAVGQMMMQHTKQRAFLGDSEFLWYWDDDSVKANCQASSSTWANPYIRRCNDYQAGTLLDAMDWETVSLPDRYSNTHIDVPDYVAVTELDWAPAGNPHYRDSFAAKGIILPTQSIATGSVKPVDFVLQELLDEVPSPEMQAADARVSASYYIVDQTGSQGILDFRPV